MSGLYIVLEWVNIYNINNIRFYIWFVKCTELVVGVVEVYWDRGGSSWVKMWERSCSELAGGYFRYVVEYVRYL